LPQEHAVSNFFAVVRNQPETSLKSALLQKTIGLRFLPVPKAILHQTKPKAFP
jgi:hypothetical protein